MTDKAVPERKQFGFFHPFRVRYAEIDGQGVMFNAHYLTYFDVAITEYMRWLDYDYMGEVERTGNDFHVVRTAVDYHVPIRFDWDVEVGVCVARLGRSSMAFECAIFRDDDLLARGDVVWVYTDQAAHKSVPLPEDLLALLAAKEGDRLPERAG